MLDEQREDQVVVFALVCCFSSWVKDLGLIVLGLIVLIDLGVKDLVVSWRRVPIFFWRVSLFVHSWLKDRGVSCGVILPGGDMDVARGRD